MMHKNRPILFILMLVVGIYIGKGCNEFGGPSFYSNSRVTDLLDQIEYLYVDSIDRYALEEAAVQAIIEELDPHSYYFSEEELASIAEPLAGGFEGIGVEFLIQNDSLMVVTALPGGPSESAGIRAGDIIIKVDTLEISGPELTNNKVIKLLKGKGGTVVNLQLLRSNSQEVYEVEIIRARIPIHSVVASILIEEEIGYIKIIRFSATTSDEFKTALVSLQMRGANAFVIDLRGNGGGYLEAATDMIDRFLPEGLPIVYTEGKSSPRYTYSSLYDGEYSHIPLVVLIDEGSASASEIFAGAMQDNDRGLIIGRRSFGKGLVQNEYHIEDEGALRLTVARFYTPSGRAIQKPYGEGIVYDQDRADRLESGELYSADSIKVTDSIAYMTSLGREVFGGGGITPDIFIPLDSTENNRALAELVWSGTLRDAAFDWVDANRITLDKMSSSVELGSSALWNDDTGGGLAQITNASKEQNNFTPRWNSEEEERIMERFLAQVSRNIFGESAYYLVLSEGDEFIDRAIYELLERSRFQLRDGRLYLLPANADTLISESFNLTPHGF
jgi:carboxyl-terminal processing protease